MSRSYRKTLMVCDRGPWYKRYANRRLRQAKNVQNGKWYRKYSDPWDIRDWAFTFSLDDEWLKGKWWKYYFK